jgi:hypothetical protein
MARNDRTPAAHEHQDERAHEFCKILFVIAYIFHLTTPSNLPFVYKINEANVFNYWLLANLFPYSSLTSSVQEAGDLTARFLS